MYTQEILILGGIIVLLFGGPKVAQLGKGLSEGIREFTASLEPLRTARAETPQAIVFQTKAWNG